MHRRVIVGGTVARSSTIDVLHSRPWSWPNWVGSLCNLNSRCRDTKRAPCWLEWMTRPECRWARVLLVERVVCSREHCRAYYCSAAAYGQVENCCERAPSCLLTRHVWLLLTIDRANAAATLSLARPVIYLYLGSLSLIVAWVMSIDSSTCWCHHRSSFRVDTSYAATEQRK